MFSKTIVCALFVFSAAAACASQAEFDLALAKAYAEYEKDVSQALALARIRLKAEMSPAGHFDLSGFLLALMACTMFLAANAAQIVLTRFGMGMTRRSFSLFMVLTVLYLNVTVSSAELLNVSEVDSEIDAIYAKFQAKWERESAEIAALELELAEASAELEQARQLEIFAIENQIADLRQLEISAMEKKIESLRQLAEASAELEQARQLEIYAIENQFEIYRQWPDAETAWPVCVIIAQLVVGAFVALTAVKVLVRVFRIMMRVLYYLLVGIFCIVNCGLVVFTIYLVFYYEWKTY